MGTKKMKVNAASKSGKVTTQDSAPDEMAKYLTPMNPTYAFRFVVLANALKHLAKSGESIVPGMSAEKLLLTGARVTGLRGSVTPESLEAAVRWYSEEIKKGVLVCPSCKVAAIVPLHPEFLAQQTDGTTHICHFYAGGCDTGFAMGREG